MHHCVVTLAARSTRESRCAPLPAVAVAQAVQTQSRVLHLVSTLGRREVSEGTALVGRMELLAQLATELRFLLRGGCVGLLG